MSDSLQSNYRAQQHDHFKRVLLAIAFFVLLVCVLIGQLFRLQILSGRVLFHRSLDNQFTFADLQSQRGEIHDRHGEVLAKNIPLFHVDLFVESRVKAQRALSKFVTEFGLEQSVHQKISERIQRARPLDTIRVFSRLSQQQRQLVYEKNLHLPPLKVTPEFIRHYPCGAPCASVTGYVLAKKQEKDQKSDNPNILAALSS